MDVAGEGTPSWQIWWLGQGQGGYLGWEGLQALRRAPVPLWLSLEPRSPLLPAGIPQSPVGLPLSLVCGVQAWNFPLHQCWLEGAALELQELHRSCSPSLAVAGAAGMEDGALNPMLILT